jgi:hypothetical protein
MIAGKKRYESQEISSPDNSFSMYSADISCDVHDLDEGFDD